MKKFQKCILLFSFLLIFVACWKKDIYDYSENEKYDLLIASYIDHDKPSEDKINEVIKELEKDYRRSDTQKRANQELVLWEAQRKIVSSMFINDLLGEFEKSYKKGKANEFIKEVIAKQNEESKK